MDWRGISADDTRTTGSQQGQFDMTIIIGTDTGEILTGGTDDDVIKGEGGNDTLSGAAGDDELDGGTGNDTMYGGTGNDNYIVDSYNDVVIEDADEGIDNIRVDTSYYWMPDNVENAGLIHTARSGSIDGNDLGNYIWVGNTGQYAALDGAGGDDTLDATANSYYVRLSGGEGNDVLWGGSGGTR